MSKLLLTPCILLFMYTDLFGQQTITGSVFDQVTKEPLPGATVVVHGTTQGTITSSNGRFEFVSSIEPDTLEVSYLGYEKVRISGSFSNLSIPLQQSVTSLEQVVITANREAALRTEAPVSISKLSPSIIADTKPVLLTELINKVPGVAMLNYNNEQHAMAIRQPMGTSAYYLYMEDGVPIRPMGVFNHNALIEMNVFGISSIEVVKGPSSSLYGPEAVGGAINFITHRPTAVTTAKLGLQADQWGYKRVQYAFGAPIGKKLGIYVSGFNADQKNSWQTYSDYNKTSVNAGMEYSFNSNTKVSLAFAANEYYSDMAGSVDSTAFYNRQYTSTTDFSYRKVHSNRTRFVVSHQWNEAQETILTLSYRDNYIEQNPNYGIRWTTGSATASGELNRNTFYSKVALLQHRIKFDFLNSRLLTGASVDYSPTSYWAYKIDLIAKLRPDGKSVEKYSIIQERPDLFISNYHAYLKNSAVYSQFEINPLERLKLTLGMRLDNMAFDYQNFLDATAGSKSYKQFTPKIGATFDLQKDKGLYANYSEGFSPPGLTAIFRKRPTVATDGTEFYYNLTPAKFRNMEVGGWASLLHNKIYLDVALYRMIGRNELLSIRQQDNSTDYQSAGRTLHHGIEYSITYKPNDEWFARFGGTNAVHRFEEFELSTRNIDNVKNVNGKSMPQSPRWIANSEVTYKPKYVRGLRLSLEWQRISSWYQDQVNNVKYDDKGFLGFRGISYLNLRTGYQWKSVEVFTNILNLTNELYANAATRGNGANDRTTFTPGAPRTFIFGIQYSLTKK